MNKNTVDLLRKQRLLSKKRVTSLNKEKDEEKLSSYFNVSKDYLDKDFNYHIFLRFGNPFIFSLTAVCLIAMVSTFFISEQGDTFVNLLVSIFCFFAIFPTFLYYRRFYLHYLLLLPLFLSIFLIGYWSFLLSVAL